MYAAETIRAPRRAAKPTGSPALSGMVIALAFLAREPFSICVRRLLGLRRTFASAPEIGACSLPAIRAAVLGRHHTHITKLFGPPRTSSQGKCPVWYYAVDASQQLAMAVTFHDGRAVLVEFLQRPTVG